MLQRHPKAIFLLQQINMAIPRETINESDEILETSQSNKHYRLIDIYIDQVGYSLILSIPTFCGLQWEYLFYTINISIKTNKVQVMKDVIIDISLHPFLTNRTPQKFMPKYVRVLINLVMLFQNNCDILT